MLCFLHWLDDAKIVVDVIQEVKETGGLKRLVALITDSAAPDEEAKGGKGEKKAGSRAAKKSAKDGKTPLIDGIDGKL